MFLIISWALVGAVGGSVGVAFIASALAKDGQRGDPNLDAIFLWLFVSTVIGTVGGVWLAKKARLKFADDTRKQNQIALLPLLAAVALVAYAALKP